MMAEAAPAEDWRTEAHCRPLPAVDKARFHSSGPRDVDFARWVCSSCPVKGPCLAMAMGDSRLYGIYAGTTYRQRWRREEPPAW